MQICRIRPHFYDVVCEIVMEDTFISVIILEEFLKENGKNILKVRDEYGTENEPQVIEFS